MKHFSKIALLGVGAAALFSLAITDMALAQSCGLFDVNCGSRHYQPPNLAPLRAGLIALSGGLGFGVGWFLSPQAAGFRARVAVALGILLVSIAVIDNGLWGWGLTPIVAIAAFAIGLGYWAQRLVKRLSERPTTFGSAMWASLKELFAAGAIATSGFRLGHVIDETGNELPVSYVGDRHMLTTAPNRSGKGTTAIIPNLLTYEGSVVVIDPKGENAMITAKRRLDMGQEVYVVDPWGITGLESACFNPLDWLKAGDVEIGDNAMILVDAIIMAMAQNDKFWDEESKALLIGATILVAIDPAYKGKRHLGTVRDLLLLDGEELKKLFKAMLQSPNAIVRSTGARCLQKEEKLLANVLASVQAQTHFLDSPHIRESLSRSDFKFEDLKSKPSSIYLVLPSDRLNSHGRWLRLLIQQALTVNARNIEQKPDKSVLFILDEMPALGKLSMVEQAFGLMAGYGMQIWGICQDASQLKRIYGDGWETFVSNAGMIQYFGSRDNMTAEYFSKLCGVTTTWNLSTAVARAFGQTSGKESSTSKTTTSTDTATGTQRKLAYADELMRMPQDRQLILMGNMNPIMAQKQPWFEDPELKDLGVNLHDKAEETDAA